MIYFTGIRAHSRHHVTLTFTTPEDRRLIEADILQTTPHGYDIAFKCALQKTPLPEDLSLFPELLARMREFQEELPPFLESL